MLKDLAVYGKDIVLDLGTLLKPQVILNDLSVHIPQGCIYGLIGPSGSGKTSFQRTIIGVYKINSGSLSVFGQTPGAKGSCVPGPLIGYMPQEIALDDELTPKELLTFLGKCASLNSESINDKINEILSIMDIDCQDRRTSAFSVGQRRRLSLACTLIHSPKLLFLDEPTVGSDIVVVKKIWDYLRYLSDSQGTTIVISTHYLEEVTKADYFGFMSKGRMLIEGQPKPFMKSVGAVTFEEAIIKQYYKSPKTIKQFAQHCETVSIAKCPESLNQLNSWTILLLIMWRYLQRWKISLAIPYFWIIFWVFFSTAFYANFFGSPFIGLHLAYLDLSNSSNYLRNVTDYLQKFDITSIKVSEEITARHFVEDQRIDGYFILPDDFDVALKSRVLTPFNDVSEADQLAGRIILYQDCAAAIKPEIFQTKLSQALQEIMDNIAFSNKKKSKLNYLQINGLIKRLDEDERLASKPIATIRQIIFNIESYSMILMTYWVNNEIRESMTERLISLGFHRKYLVIGLILLSTLFLVPAFLLLLFCSILYNDLPYSGSIIYSIPIILGVTLCGIGKGVLLGTLVTSHVNCLVVNIFYAGTIFVLGCLTAPSEALPYYIKPVAYVLPHLIPSNTLIRLIIYGNGIENSTVQLGLVYTIGMAIMHVILNFYISRKW